MDMDDFDIPMIDPDEIDRIIVELDNTSPLYQGEPPNDQMAHCHKNENVSKPPGNSYDSSLGSAASTWRCQNPWPEFNYDSLMPPTPLLDERDPTAENDLELGNPRVQDIKTWFDVGQLVAAGNEELQVPGSGDVKVLLPIEMAPIKVTEEYVEKNERTSSGDPEPNPSCTSTTGRARRRIVPEEDKDEEYWEKRRKNAEATKRCREKKKIKLGEIMAVKISKEQELANLRDRYKKLKKKCSVVEKSNQSLEIRLSKIAELCEIDAPSSELENAEE